MTADERRAQLRGYFANVDEDKRTLEHVVRAAVAVETNTTIDRLDDGADSIRASFADPLIHSRSEMADWAVKINSMRPTFGQTDVAARMVGIDDADLESVKSDETRAAAAAMAQSIFGGGNE